MYRWGVSIAQGVVQNFCHQIATSAAPCSRNGKPEGNYSKTIAALARAPRRAAGPKEDGSTSDAPLVCAASEIGVGAAAITGSPVASGAAGVSATTSGASLSS